MLRKEVIIMIELFLSSDGKHTVHVSSETVEEMAKLVPDAKALYSEVLEEFNSQVQPWSEHGGGNGDGQLKVGRRMETVKRKREIIAPRCPDHQVPMEFRRGRFGPFWSCPTKEPDGTWCRATQEIIKSGNGLVAAS